MRLTGLYLPAPWTTNFTSMFAFVALEVGADLVGIMGKSFSIGLPKARDRHVKLHIQTKGSGFVGADTDLQ